MSTGQSRKGFDIDLREGILKEGERSLLAMEGTRIEVKTDHKAIETGRLFLEFEQAGPPTYEPRPSGVAITVAEWWAHILLDRQDRIHAILINPTEHIKAIGRIAFKRGMEAKGGDHNLYRGVLVPLGWFLTPTKPVGQNHDGTWGELGWFTEALYREWG